MVLVWYLHGALMVFIIDKLLSSFSADNGIIGHLHRSRGTLNLISLFNSYFSQNIEIFLTLNVFPGRLVG